MKKVLLSVAATIVVVVLTVIAVNSFTSEKADANVITELSIDSPTLEKGSIIDAKCEEGKCEEGKCEEGKCGEGDDDTGDDDTGDDGGDEEKCGD